MLLFWLKSLCSHTNLCFLLQCVRAGLSPQLLKVLSERVFSRCNQLWIMWDLSGKDCVLPVTLLRSPDCQRKSYVARHASSPSPLHETVPVDFVAVSPSALSPEDDGLTVSDAQTSWICLQDSNKSAYPSHLPELQHSDVFLNPVKVPVPPFLPQHLTSLHWGFIVIAELCMSIWNHYL